MGLSLKNLGVLSCLNIKTCECFHASIKKTMSALMPKKLHFYPYFLVFIKDATNPGHIF